MPYVQRPCVCGGTNFQVLPNMNVFHGQYTNTQHRWIVTAVVCIECTRTELFTSNSDQVAANLTGARMITAGQS